VKQAPISRTQHSVVIGRTSSSHQAFAQRAEGHRYAISVLSADDHLVRLVQSGPGRSAQATAQKL